MKIKMVSPLRVYASVAPRRDSSVCCCTILYSYCDYLKLREGANLMFLTPVHIWPSCETSSMKHMCRIHLKHVHRGESYTEAMKCMGPPRSQSTSNTPVLGYSSTEFYVPSTKITLDKPALLAAHKMNFSPHQNMCWCDNIHMHSINLPNLTMLNPLQTAQLVLQTLSPSIK